jgi:hypothetical protein
MRTVVLVAAMAAFVSTSSQAADNPFIGTWKTNPAKSQVSGRTVTYSKTSTGFHFAGATGQAYDFALDGHEYPAEAGEMIAWTPTGANQWQTTTKLKGKTIVTGRINISPDGKTMTESYSMMMPDGAESPGKVVRSRLSGGPGLAGTWKTLEASVDPDVTIISEPAPGRLRMDTPRRRESIDGPTDGTPFAMTGPDIPQDWYATLKFTNPSTLEWTGGFRDRPRVKGIETVSSDGKELTTVYWFIGKDAEKFTEVSDKQ